MVSAENAATITLGGDATHLLGSALGPNRVYGSIFASNWSGYVAATSGDDPQQAISGAKGSFSVPLLSKATPGMVAIWIGVGGILKRDKQLIQAGVDVNSASGTIEYYAWYELYPDPQTKIPVTIHGGDKVTVTVQSVAGLNQWKIALNNLITGENYTTTVTYKASMLSAEWIVEAPVLCTWSCNQAGLPDFEKIQFEKSQVAIGGQELAISKVWYDGVVIVKIDTGKVKALTENSSLTEDGTSFSVKKTHG